MRNSIIALTLLFIALVAAAQDGKKPDVPNVVGSWKVVSFNSIEPNANILMFTKEGRVRLLSCKPQDCPTTVEALKEKIDASGKWLRYEQVDDQIEVSLPDQDHKDHYVIYKNERSPLSSHLWLRMFFPNLRIPAFSPSGELMPPPHIMEPTPIEMTPF